MLQLDGISIAYSEKTVVHDLSVDFPNGSLTAIVGPNGSGKSTLLRAMARTLRPYKGDVLLDGVSIFRQDTKLLARKLAILSQGARSPEDYTVERLVLCGRIPYAKFGGRLAAPDFDAAHQAMEAVGIEAMAHRLTSTLSGGECQRAWLAMLLAQQPRIMLLDEPTTYLDIGSQYSLLRLIRQLNREQGITIIMVLHDLNQAARFSERMLVLREGKIRADGPPKSVLTPEILRDTFQLSARVLTDAHTGIPYYLPDEKGL